MVAYNPHEYSVYQWFLGDERYEKVKEFVNAEEAVDTATNLAKSVGAKLGTTTRVIITDGWDNCCWEWTREDGIVFPQEFAGMLKYEPVKVNKC